MDKLLTYAGYDPQSGPHIFPIETTSLRLVKMATALHPDIQQYMVNAKPIVGKTQMLIDALGNAEFWGPNVNGDLFNTPSLAHEGEDYGHRTFEIYAHPFKSHVNKNPDRAYGDKVTMARYFAPTGRVQLIVAYHNNKAADIINDVDEGNYPSVSMGCRVPNDRCSICGNLAKTRAEYCEHLKYQMNKILSDGRVVGAWNDKPKFFDISVVLIGAEKQSHILKKVAHAGSYEISSALAGERMYGPAKSASQTKDADIDKDVPSNIPPTERFPPTGRAQLGHLMDGMSEAKGTEQTMDPKVLDALSDFDLPQIFSTLAAVGIPLKPHEFQKIMLIKLGHAEHAREFWNEGIVFDESAGAMTDHEALHFQPAAVNEKVAMLFRPYLAERSILPDALEHRLDNFEKRAEDWYGEASRPSSNNHYLSMLPLMLGLAGAYKLVKHKLPAPVGIDRAMAAHPWLLPLLIGMGVTGSTVLRGLLTPIQMHNQRLIDTVGGGKYAAVKTAVPWLTLGALPATYAYSGVQRHRAMQGEHLNWLDRQIALRPELAGIAALLAAPKAARAVRAVGKFVKGASVPLDLAAYAVGSGTRLMPAALAGAAIDLGILKGIEKIIKRRSTRDANFTQ
jgi:hypothetical protein